MDEILAAKRHERFIAFIPQTTQRFDCFFFRFQVAIQLIIRVKTSKTLKGRVLPDS